MRRREHAHVCRTCRQDYPCDGPLERNHDGWPEVVCLIYHVDGHDECGECREMRPEPEKVNTA